MIVDPLVLHVHGLWLAASEQVLSETQAAQRPATVQASSSGDSGTKIPLLSDGQEAVFKWWIGLLTAGARFVFDILVRTSSRREGVFHPLVALQLARCMR